MNMFKHTRVAFVFILASLLSLNAHSQEKNVLVQSTTSTANSGLYKYLLPLFQDETGIKVNVVAVGTGQAIRNARNCDADVLLVHSKKAEEQFVADGFGIERFDLMYNDFILIGPESNPANIEPTDSITQTLQKIIETQSLFASRGDDSGTHKKELALWRLPNSELTVEDESWYRSTGSGMGATINTAIGLGAYTLSDRASWISFNNKQNYSIWLEGDQALLNQYGVIQVSADKCPSVAQTSATNFIEWLRSDGTQQHIAEFKMNGQQLFFPNAR